MLRVELGAWATGNVSLHVMTTEAGDFELTMDELRSVAAYVVQSAQAVLPVFERDHRDDPRPRDAINAAQAFIRGDARLRLQRTAAMDAHRAAAEASNEPARLAARAAGDAASAAYLHPIAQATQVGHILRATAIEARLAELDAGEDPSAGLRTIQQACQRATPTLLAVLKRYPPAPNGKSPVAHLMSTLDASLRATAD